METMFKNVNREEIYYLTSKPDIVNRQFGWYTMDDKININWKYLHFIYNTDISYYDWYIFIEDDTFVFTDRLKNLLSEYNSNDSYYIGRQLNDAKLCQSYMSSGCGFAISNQLYKRIYNYIKHNGINLCYNNRRNDVCFGIWIQDIEKENNIKRINNELFYEGNEPNLKKSITVYKVQKKEKYDFYYSIMNKNNEEIDT
jgi:hypothetical protein